MDDSVVLRDADGEVILEFYRHGGRPKVYVHSPSTPSTSISDKQVLELAAFLLATYGERDGAMAVAMAQEVSLRGSFHAILREMSGGAIDKADIETALERLLAEIAKDRPRDEAGK